MFNCFNNDNNNTINRPKSKDLRKICVLIRNLKNLNFRKFIFNKSCVSSIEYIKAKHGSVRQMTKKKSHKQD